MWLPIFPIFTTMMALTNQEQNLWGCCELIINWNLDFIENVGAYGIYWHSKKIDIGTDNLLIASDSWTFYKLGYAYCILRNQMINF